MHHARRQTKTFHAKKVFNLNFLTWRVACAVAVVFVPRCLSLSRVSFSVAVWVLESAQMWARGQSLGRAARGQGQRNYPHTPAYIGHAQLTLTLFSRIIMWFPACVLLVFSSCFPSSCGNLITLPTGGNSSRNWLQSHSKEWPFYLGHQVQHTCGRPSDSNWIPWRAEAEVRVLLNPLSHLLHPLLSRERLAHWEKWGSSLGEACSARLYMDPNQSVSSLHFFQSSIVFTYFLSVQTPWLAVFTRQDKFALSL